MTNYKNNNTFSFEIIKWIPGKLGYAGIIHTPHGDIKTPAFVSVGTKGEVKFVFTEDLYLIQTQVMLSNGYHLRNAPSEIAENDGPALWSGWNGPTLIDSGGLQVMSLGSGMGRVVNMKRENGVINTDPKDRLVHITEDSIRFHDPSTDQEDFIGSEESIQIQCRIGTDIHMAYDELTSPANNYEYSVEALARIERRAIRSMSERKKHCDDFGYHQSFYGALQSRCWEDLYRPTVKRFAEMDSDGYGLGGAFLKESLGGILHWCCGEFPETKPRHLLGLSHPDDILIGAEMGADTFDCAAPTHEARHGRLYTKHGPIKLSKFTDSPFLLDENCDYPACQAGWTCGEPCALQKFGNTEGRHKYFNLATLHNLCFIIRLTENTRQAILEDRFAEFKEAFLKCYHPQSEK